YRTTEVAGDRFLCVGDAGGFVDPIFSSGVYVAMQTGEMAASGILVAFAGGRLGARPFPPSTKPRRPRVRPLLRSLPPWARASLRRSYRCACAEVCRRPRARVALSDGVSGVLAGGAFLRMRLRSWGALAVVSGGVRVRRWRRRWRGRPVESRLEW